MASQSEIVLVDPTKLAAAPSPKSGKKRAGAAKSHKAAKRSTTRKNSKHKLRAQPCGTDILPVMKLRAVDIVDSGNVTTPEQGGPEEGNTDSASGEESHVIQMPPPDSPETGNGSESLVTDPELLELLEQLSTTIDTAHTVLDAASGVPAEESANSNPKPEPSPQPESEPDVPPPLAAEFAEPALPEPPAPRTGWGFGMAANAAITGLILAAGAAWLTYTNPWLLETEPGAPSELEQTVSASPVKGLSQPAQTDQAPNSIAGKPVISLASFAPPEDDPVPMEIAAPPAPLPAATVSRQIQVAPGQSTPLRISLPATPDQSEISVMIQDVPKKAKLSAGKSLGAGNWLLEQTQLNELNLETAEGLAPGNYQLEVIFVRSDGKVPETRKVSLMVKPAASEPAASPTIKKLAPEAKTSETGELKTTFVKPGVAVEIPAVSLERLVPAPVKPANIAEAPKISALSAREVTAILTRGGTLLNEGDIAGARLLLEYASKHGSKLAMIKLGESYDPKYLAKLGARGVQPDVDQAAHWYNRASAAQ